MDYLMFLCYTLFSSILENAQFEIMKLAHVLNANKPWNRLFRVTSCPCLHHLFINYQKHANESFYNSWKSIIADFENIDKRKFWKVIIHFCKIKKIVHFQLFLLSLLLFLQAKPNGISPMLKKQIVRTIRLPLFLLSMMKIQEVFNVCLSKFEIAVSH